VEHVEIRLSGSGGQGLLLGALILAEALMAEGYLVAQSQAFEPVSRGGVSRSDLVADRAAPDYPLVTALDALLVLDQCAVEVSRGLTRPGALVLVDSERVPEPPRGEVRLHALGLLEAARRVGNPRVANMAALGALARLGGWCGLESLRAAVRNSVPPPFVEASLAALAAGDALAAAALAEPAAGDALAAAPSRRGSTA
jgi:2-oxoglutarate ferredoxin oxidoreductase subunit gamma